MGILASHVSTKGRADERACIPGTNIDKLSNALDFRGLMEISRCNGLANHVDVRPGRDELHLLKVHDIFQLSSDLASFAEKLGMKEVADAPLVAIPARQR